MIPESFLPRYELVGFIEESMSDVPDGPICDVSRFSCTSSNVSQALANACTEFAIGWNAIDTLNPRKWKEVPGKAFVKRRRWHSVLL